jgi:hypothetical protein
MILCCGLMWVRNSEGVMSTRLWTLGFHRRSRISWLEAIMGFSSGTLLHKSWLDLMLYCTKTISPNSWLCKLRASKLRPNRRQCSCLQSFWPRSLKHKMFLPAQKLWSWVRIPFKTWISVCFSLVFVSSYVGSGLSSGWLIPRLRSVAY